MLGLFFVIFLQFELSHFFEHLSEWIAGTLCAQLLLQFNTDTFETLQTLFYLKICMWVGYTPQINFVTFLQFELSHFLDIFTS